MSDFVESLKTIGGAAAKKGGELVQTGSVKAQILKKKSDIKGAYAKIGEYLYTNRDAVGAVLEEDEALKELFDAIDVLNVEINDLNNQLEIGKAE